MMAKLLDIVLSILHQPALMEIVSKLLMSDPSCRHLLMGRGESR